MEIRHYLQKIFKHQNINKYHKYFDEWFNNLTNIQLMYFERDMHKKR